MATDLDLCATFIAAHPAEAAQVLERQRAADVARLLEELKPEAAADVLGRMVATPAAEILVQLPPAAASAVARRMPPDSGATLLRRIDEPARSALLESLRPEDANPLRALLAQREGTAGALMDPRALALPDDVTVGEGLARVRRAARDMLSYLYVVDREGRLAGVLSVRELILARPSERLAAVMHSPVAAVRASAGHGGILTHPGWRDFHALPVIDEHMVFQGAIRYRTLRRLLDAEGERPAEAAVATTVALGELYWLGLTSLLQGVSSVGRERTPGEGEREGNRGA